MEHAKTSLTSKDEAVRELARLHYQVEDGLTHIVRLTGTVDKEVNPAEPIKLLEVNAATVPSGVLPPHFGPAPASGIPFASVIVEVTLDEFEQIKADRLRLPAGWSLGEEIPKPTASPVLN
jgi:hypothetical protein